MGTGQEKRGLRNGGFALMRLLDALQHQVMWLVALLVTVWHPEWVSGAMMVAWTLMAIIVELCSDRDGS